MTAATGFLELMHGTSQTARATRIKSGTAALLNDNTETECKKSTSAFLKIGGGSDTETKGTRDKQCRWIHTAVG